MGRPSDVEPRSKVEDERAKADSSRMADGCWRDQNLDRAVKISVDQKGEGETGEGRPGEPRPGGGVEVLLSAPSAVEAALGCGDVMREIARSVPWAVHRIG